MYLREIDYTRHEYLHPAKDCKGTLVSFIYDIPYFPACGIFPPIHILNQVLMSGGSPGGMGPGATWRPFSISQEEYADLTQAVKQTPVSDIRADARYAWLPMKFDASFDHILDKNEWIAAVCEKHRDHWHKAMRKAGYLD